MDNHDSQNLSNASKGLQKLLVQNQETPCCTPGSVPISCLPWAGGCPFWAPLSTSQNGDVSTPHSRVVKTKWNRRCRPLKYYQLARLRQCRSWWLVSTECLTVHGAVDAHSHQIAPAPPTALWGDRVSLIIPHLLSYSSLRTLRTLNLQLCISVIYAHV